MKVENFDYSVQSEGVLSSKTMGFDEKGKVYIYEMLRKNIYSDPVLAIIREVYCNSKDSHVIANQKDKQIEVTFPTFDQPNFIIKDYGTGLSHEEIYNIYANYGASTKRDDNNQIGSLGIGAKSPFAYTDSFTITSINNGVKNIYNAVILHSGEGVLNHIHKERTNEPAGLEVNVPVQPQDIDTFINKGINYFRHLSERPIFHNLFKAIPEKEYIIQNNEYARFKDNLPSMVIMGSIPYILDTSKLGEDLTSGQKKAFERHWEFYVNIGDVDFSANRETLRYTEKTINIINALILKAIDHYQREIDKQFENCKNLLEAKCLWYELDSNNLFYKFCPKKVFWNGVEITDSKFKFEDDSGFKLYQKVGYRKSLVEVSYIYAQNNTKIYFFIDKISYKRERLQFLEYNSFVLQIDSSITSLADIISANHLDGFQFIDLKTVSFVKPIRDRSKYLSGLLYDNRGSLSIYNTENDCWDEYRSTDDDKYQNLDSNTETFYYLPIYKKESDNSLKNGEYFSKFRFGVKHGLFNFNLYGVPTNLKIKNKKNWVRFSDFLNQFKVDTIKKFANLSESRKNDFFLCNYLVSNLTKEYNNINNKEIRRLKKHKESLIKKTDYYRYSMFAPELGAKPESFFELREKYENVINNCKKNTDLLELINESVFNNHYNREYKINWLDKEDISSIQKFILNYKFKNKNNEIKLQNA